jgi:hypothetical protein
MAGLSDFMDANASTGFGYSPGLTGAFRGARPHRLADSGGASKRIADAARRPELAEQVLASLFWWCYVRTERFPSDSRGASSSPGTRQVIVSHARGTRHDLLLLAPDVVETFEATVSGDFPPGLRSPGAYGRGLTAVALQEGGRMGDMLLRAGIDVDPRTAVLAVSQLAQNADFRLVVAERPVETPTDGHLAEQTAVGSFAAPAPALPVTVASDPRPLATAGVIGTDEAGRMLAITALHAVAGTTTEQLLVGGAAASIVGEHQLTDSCLLSVTCRAGTSSGRAGILDFAPQSYRSATFDGAASLHKETIIRGSDLSILAPSPFLSSKVYTDPQTLPGDSGSALIDHEDHIVGFAVSRTALGAAVEFSIWSWAEQVLAAHGLA